MLIRFPLEITQSERVPRKPEPWSEVIGKGLVVLAILALLVFVVFPLMEQQ